MYKFGFSLILFDKVHIDKFKNYSLKTIINNLKITLREKDKIIFYLSTNRKNLEIILNIFKENLNTFKWYIEYDFQAEELFNKDFNYVKLGKIQAYHAKKIINQKAKYLCFLYSDILYSKFAFRECINILKRKSAVGSFAISLNTNKNFKNFYKKLLVNKHLPFFLKNSKELISNFHKKFIYKNNYFTQNCNLIIYLTKTLLLIKSLHFHPILIKSNKCKQINISTLDSSFYNLFNSQREIYVEKKMKKFSIFSCDDKKLQRNQNTQQNISYNNLNNDLLLLNLYNSITNERYNSNIFFQNYQNFSINDNESTLQINKNLNYLLSKKNIKKIVQQIIIDKNKFIFNKFNILILISLIIKYIISNNFITKSFIFKKTFYGFYKKYFSKFFIINSIDFKKERNLSIINHLRFLLFKIYPSFFIKKFVLSFNK